MSCQSEGEAVGLRQERSPLGWGSQLSRVTRSVAGVAFSSLKCSPGAPPVPESVEGPAWFVLCLWPCWLRPNTFNPAAVLRAAPEGPGCLLPFSLSSRLPTLLIPFREHLWLLLTPGDCFKSPSLFQLFPSPNGSPLKESKSSSSASAVPCSRCGGTWLLA